MTNKHTALLADFLSSCGVLRQAWSKLCLTNELSLSTRKTAVADQLDLIEENEERCRLQSMLKADLYPLAYNGISSTNPDPGCDLDLFQSRGFVAAEMQVHAHSFPPNKNRGAAIGYTF